MSDLTVKDVFTIVDRIDNRMDSLEKKIDTRIIRYETKVDKIESKYDTFMGSIAAMSAFISFLAPTVLTYIKQKIFR